MDNTNSIGADNYMYVWRRKCAINTQLYKSQKSIFSYSYMNMDQITISNVKGVACSDKYRESSTNSAVLLSSMERFSLFQLLVLVLWPVNVLFGFSLTILINLVSIHSRSCFH